MIFRFSIRGLLLSVVCLGIALSMLGPLVRRSLRVKAQADQLRRNGAEVFFDSEGETNIEGGNELQGVLSCPFRQYWQPQSALLPKIASVEFVDKEIRSTVAELLGQAGPIERLAFDHCKIGNREWNAIQSVRNIRFLALSDCRINTLEPLRRHNMNTIEFLSLANAGLTVDLLESLRGFPSLEALDLSSNPIGDEVTPILISMPRLRTVALDKTGIGDETLKALARVQGIEHISVYDTNVSAQQIAEIESTRKIHLGHRASRGSCL